MLEEKVVVITGSGQGIGKHAARTFAENKAKVVIADFDRDKMQRSAAEIGKLMDQQDVLLSF